MNNEHVLLFFNQTVKKVVTIKVVTNVNVFWS